MKWIKFNEQKPDNRQRIICYLLKDDLMDFAEFIRDDTNDWLSIGVLDNPYNPTIDHDNDYWMPLPEKPQ